MVPLTAPPSEIECFPDRRCMAELVIHVEKTWTEMGQTAPHWSVVSRDSFRPEQFEAHKDAFFRTGLSAVGLLSATLARVGRKLSDFEHCYEYGCGVGRVTLPLANEVKRLSASDISPTILDLARDTLKNVRNVDLVQVEGYPNFGMRESFDLWYCRIVLQHNPPPVMAAILERAFSLLKPNGIAVFQVPTYALKYSFNAKEYLAAINGHSTIEMHCLPQKVIFDLARRFDCYPLEIREDESAGHIDAWISNQFVFQKV